MILNVTAAQREYLRTALEIYSDELSDAAEAIHSRRLKAGFNNDADSVKALLSQVVSLKEMDSMDTREEVVVEFLRKGQKIHAIKYIREQGTLGLKDAKDYVDQIQAARL